jgi:hypothetical protein
MLSPAFAKVQIVGSIILLDLPLLVEPITKQ